MSLPEYRPAVAPAAVYPREGTVAHVTPYSSQPEQVRVAWVQSATDPRVSVPVDARLLQPMERTPARDLTPAPLIDPRAQLVLAGGVGAGAAGAGVGWGIGQAFTGIAALSGSSAVLVALLLLLVAKARGGQRGGDTYHVTNNNRWWGKSTSIKK